MRAKILKSCRNCCSVPKLCSTANWSSTSGGATTATFYFNWQSENKAVTHSVSPAAKCQSVGRVGLLTCRIKRASSAACCTVDREGAALVGFELGLRAAPPGTTSSFRAGRASSALDLASSLRTFTFGPGPGTGQCDNEWPSFSVPFGLFLLPDCWFFTLSHGLMQLHNLHLFPASPVWLPGPVLF